MCENVAEKDIRKKSEKEIESEKKWQKAYAPRMRQIVSGLILGNVQSSWNIEMLAANRIKAVVSLSDGSWGRWRSHTRTVPEHHHKWVQAVDSSTQDLLVYMSDTCDFIEQLASPDLSSLTSLPIDDDHTKDNKLEAIMVHCDLVWEEVGYQVWENKDKTVPKPAYKAFLDDRAALLKEKGLTGE
ncbi:dual specificity protein phosphatase 5 [Penicillium mononematosum]|uniref:dual specificity protein phosphatase 5 n=1 Tax=Penicillium mononematosum TaxID=268346 RepID=UPI0025472C07|nr:dual specificity protein phosphatase 5 [Penicillium mononematosum]KAJ6177732.1 dual specificity protein phosphatase 5 [Penicillium mononematosum]